MFEKGELKANEIYEIACASNPKLAEDTRLKGLMSKISNREYDLTIADAVYVSENIIPGGRK